MRARPRRILLPHHGRRRLAVLRLLVTLLDRVFGDRQGLNRIVGFGGLLQQSHGDCARACNANLIGLIGNDGGDIAAFRHVDRERLGQVKGYNLRVGVSGVAKSRQNGFRWSGPSGVDAVEDSNA